MRLIFAVFGMFFLALLSGGCSQERSRVPDADADAGNNGNYHAMIDHARSRQTVADALGTIEKSIEQFRSRVGRLPTNLIELVDLGYLKILPSPPDGYSYAYDPTHGNVILADHLQQAREPPANSDTARKPSP